MAELILTGLVLAAVFHAAANLQMYPKPRSYAEAKADYEGAKAELRASWRKLKEGG